MSDPPTLGHVIERHGARLGLEVHPSGPDGHTRALDLDTPQGHAAALAGHMNLIRPNRVQVLGSVELDHLNGLETAPARALVQQLLRPRPTCVIVADGLTPPPFLLEACTDSGTPLLTARVASQQVVHELAYFFSRAAAARSSLHGVFIEVMGVGVLLTGPPGVGKSELALELVSRGHRLIADDAPEFSLVAPDTVEGSCPPALRDFMEVRGLGIINVRAMFGDSAVKPRRTLRLVINLAVMDRYRYNPQERLQGIRGRHEILGVSVPEVSLPVAPGHNMAVLVECTVRNYFLDMRGYDAAEDFAERHNAILRGEQIADG